MNSSLSSLRARQGGMTLVVGLIMLVLMTIMAISMFHMGTAQTVVVANAQQSARGVAAAQQAIDTVLNSSAFSQNPDLAIVGTTGCASGAANTLCVSSNGNTVKDFTVTLTPKPFCISASPIPSAQLDLSAGPSSPDMSCLTSAQQGQFAVAGSAAGDTLCATSVWEVGAKAVDDVTNTTVLVTEGVGLRILTAEMSNFCPI